MHLFDSGVFCLAKGAFVESAVSELINSHRSAWLCQTSSQYILAHEEKQRNLRPPVLIESSASLARSLALLWQHSSLSISHSAYVYSWLHHLIRFILAARNTLFRCLPTAVAKLPKRETPPICFQPDLLLGLLRCLSPKTGGRSQLYSI